MKAHQYFLCVVWALLLVVGAGAGAQAQMQEGGPLLLSKLVAEQQGKPVLVNFFASWCPPCKEEIPGLVAVRKHYSLEDVAIIGVALDDTRSNVTSLVKSMGVNYPVILGNNALGKAFGIRSIPHMVVYSAQGDKVLEHTGLLTEAQLRSLVEQYLVK